MAEAWGWPSFEEFLKVLDDARGAHWEINPEIATEIARIRSGTGSTTRTERSRMSRDQLLELVDALERQVAELTRGAP
jgi:hypothetical protein